MIHRAVEQRLGKDAIHTGCRLGAFTQDEGGVTAYFFDRNGSHRDVRVGLELDPEDLPGIATTRGTSEPRLASDARRVHRVKVQGGDNVYYVIARP